MSDDEKMQRINRITAPQTSMIAKYKIKLNCMIKSEYTAMRLTKMCSFLFAQLTIL